MVTLSPSVCEGFQLLHILTSKWCFINTFYFIHSNRYAMVSQCGFTFSLVASDVNYFFMCLYISSLMKDVFKSFTCFFQLDCLYFLSIQFWTFCQKLRLSRFSPKAFCFYILGAINYYVWNTNEVKDILYNTRRRNNFLTITINGVKPLKSVNHCAVYSTYNIIHQLP